MDIEKEVVREIAHHLRKSADRKAQTFIRGFIPFKALGEEFNALILYYTRELSRPFKENKGLTTVREEQDRQVRCQTTAAPRAFCARSYFHVFFPPPFVESQMAQVDRLRILERVVFSSCPYVLVVFHSLFLVKLLAKLKQHWRKKRWPVLWSIFSTLAGVEVTTSSTEHSGMLRLFNATKIKKKKKQ